jgi:hypothetical protein
MTDWIVIVLLLVMVYFLWSLQRALVHICGQLAILRKFAQQIKCHRTGTEAKWRPPDLLQIIEGDWWRRVDSNHGPTDYETVALAT